MDILSIDLGFGWSKGMFQNKRWSEPSVIGETKKIFDQNKKKGYLIYRGEEGSYFVGMLAQRYSDVKYRTIKDNKAETWTTKIILKTMLGSLTPNKQVNIVSGLPIDYYFSQKDSLVTMFDDYNRSKPYEIESMFEYRYTTKSIINDHKIVPQPLGSAMDYLLDDKGVLAKKNEAKGRILVVDIGYFTLDLLILEGLGINKDSYTPPDLGVNVAYKLLQQSLRDKFGKSPARHDLDNVIIEGEYEGYDVRPLIQQAFQSLATQIMLEIESLNMNFNAVIMTGGAANLIACFLEIDNLVVLHSPQMGNVRGYNKIGKRLWLNGSR